MHPVTTQRHRFHCGNDNPVAYILPANLFARIILVETCAKLPFESAASPAREIPAKRLNETRLGNFFSELSRIQRSRDLVAFRNWFSFSFSENSFSRHCSLINGNSIAVRFSFFFFFVILLWWRNNVKITDIIGQCIRIGWKEKFVNSIALIWWKYT